MAVTNFFVVTAAERSAIAAFDSEDLQFGGRLIDNTSPGVGINLNDNAADYEPGDVVTLAGKYVADKRMVDDPDYVANVPGMIALLAAKPFCLLEPETIFAPPEI